jgi:hypothetical protein
LTIFGCQALSNRDVLIFSSRDTDDVACPSPALEGLLPDLLKAAALASVVVPMPAEGAQGSKQQTHSSGDIPVQDEWRRSRHSRVT